MLYLALADSVISYGLSSYGRTYKTYLNNIYKLQIRLLKTIVPKKIKLKYQHDYSELFQYCHILPVQNMIKLSILKEEYNNISKLKTHNYPKNLRDLKDRPIFKLPRYKNIYGMRTYNYFLPKIINNLPKDIQDLYLHTPRPLKKIKKKLLNLNNSDYVL